VFKLNNDIFDFDLKLDREVFLSDIMPEISLFLKTKVSGQITLQKMVELNN